MASSKDHELPEVHPHGYLDRVPVDIAAVNDLMAQARAATSPVRVSALELLDESLPTLLQELQSCPSVECLLIGPAEGSVDVDGWSTLLAGAARLGPRLRSVLPLRLERVPGALADARVRAALSESSSESWTVRRVAGEDGAAVLESLVDNRHVKHLSLHIQGGESAVVWAAACDVLRGGARLRVLDLACSIINEADAEGFAALVRCRRALSCREVMVSVSPMLHSPEDQPAVGLVVRALRSGGWPAGIEVRGLSMLGLPDVEREVIADIRGDAMVGLRMLSWEVSRALLDVLAEELPRMTRLRELSLESMGVDPDCEELDVLAGALATLPDRRLEMRLDFMLPRHGEMRGEAHPMRRWTGLLESDRHRSVRVRVARTVSALRESRAEAGGAAWHEALARRLEVQDGWDLRWRRRGGLVLWRGTIDG